MTFADDFATDEMGLEEDYPSVLGITFTPMVTGIAIAVAGITLAVYGYIKYVNPAKETYQQAVTQKQELQQQLNGIKSGDLQLKLAQLQADLAEKQVLKSRVISMFTSEDDLETLLIDLNRFIAANQAELIQYQPDSNVNVVSDASLGSGVQGKLKRKGISLTFEGTFNETKQILQDLERLQPLLMVQSISSTVTEKPTALLTGNRNEIVPQKQAELKTQIKLDAVLPMSQAELEKAKKADEQAEQAERQSRRKSRNK
ncbi:type II and III secretion system protein [Pleurocapsales cyanobacterium LEGE 10410]|nr:type II and III secretion system protein [Pleurocapsales cyanobacterium LEGE 10410]